MPVRAQLGQAGTEVSVHARHVLPRLVVALGNVELVAGTEPRRPLLVVDGLDPLGEQPSEHDPLIRDGRGTAHGRNVRTGAVGFEVDVDPLDRRLVGGIASEQAQAFDILALERLLARQQVLPPRVLGVHPLEARRVSLERLLDARISRTETDSEREVRVASDRPCRNGGEQADEDVFRHPPLLLDVRPTQLSNELCGGPFERVLRGIGRRSRDHRREELAGQGADGPIDPALLANRLTELGREAGVGNEHTDGLETLGEDIIQKACHATYLIHRNRGRIVFGKPSSLIDVPFC